ncbi:MAG: hypothetical protein ACRD2E_14505 [Terriglobales bacterium]
MPLSTIAAGQVWRQDATGAHFLVTRVYTELFDRFVILHQVEGGETLRLKLRPGDTPMPGYTQESSEFDEGSTASAGQ